MLERWRFVWSVYKIRRTIRRAIRDACRQNASSKCLLRGCVCGRCTEAERPSRATRFPTLWW